MENINAHGNLYLLLPVIFLAMSSMVRAGEIVFYKDPNACEGSGYYYSGIGEKFCCFAKDAQGSVLFTFMDSCKGGYMFKQGICSGNAAEMGLGNGCYTSGGGGSFTSAYWSQVQGCKLPSLLADDDTSDTEKCKGVAEPTGFVFTEYAKKGTWLLTTSNAVELYSQLENLPHGEKANWLQSKGATFDTSHLLMPSKKLQ